MTGYYAFWEYDQYPYVLGGEVVSLDDRGVEVKGYTGLRFKPKLIVPLERGKDLQAKLDVLRREKRQALADVHDQFAQRLRAFANNERISL